MVPTNEPQTEQARYAAAWQESRRRWRRFLAFWMGGPLVMFAVGMALQPLELILAAMGLTWMAGSTLLAFNNAGFPCPRCGEAFYLRGLYGNPYTRNCLHCRLRWGAPGPESR